MLKSNNWLKEQRVAGGTSFASSMLRTQASTEEYVNHITKLVGQRRELPLTIEQSMDNYQITCNENIVWFGRDVDVEQLRATKVTAFEDYLDDRLDRLIELGLVDVVGE